MTRVIALAPAVPDVARPVDARPLLAGGVLEPAPRTLGEPDVRRLHRALDDDDTYRRIVLLLSHAAAGTARHLAGELETDVAPVRAAVEAALREWHMALWRILDRPLTLGEEACHRVVLAPVPLLAEHDVAAGGPTS